MDELKKTCAEENNTAEEQNTEATVTLSDDEVEKVAGGYDGPCL